jgi:hypothetical protein
MKEVLRNPTLVENRLRPEIDKIYGKGGHIETIVAHFD